MNWTEHAWLKALPVIEGIKKLPFIIGLIDGTLDREKFKHYISQDSIYLEHFGRALALIAARADRVDHVLEFIRFSEGAIVVENALHSGYFKELNIAGDSRISPGCHHYASFLLKEAALSPVETAMAAVLPCFWIYKYIGDYIYDQQNAVNNPYQNWIDTYAGEDFGKIVQRALLICDEVAGTCTTRQREKMTDAFLYACQLEWMFWDSAYKQGEWPF